MSGYVHCACRDCFDTAISGDERPTLCLLCKEAGCVVGGGDGLKYPSHFYECQRTDAYGCGDDDFEIVAHPRVWPNYIDNPEG